MTKIDLPNRYGDSVYLEQDKENNWWLVGDKSAFLSHRVIYSNDDHKIRAVDPSGGPFLCVGYIVNNKTVTNIEFIKGKGYKVTLEDLHK